MVLRPNARVTVIVLVGLVIALSMTGCSSTPKSSTKALSMQEIDDTIRQTVDLSNLKLGDGAKLKKLYDISIEDLDSFVLYLAPSNLKADELLLLKAKSEADLAALKTKIAKRVDKQAIAFKDYLPAEYFLIQKHISKVSGTYVLLVISKNAEQIAEAFDRIVR